MKMIMKKTRSILLITLMSFVLFSCSKPNNENNKAQLEVQKDSALAKSEEKDKKTDESNTEEGYSDIKPAKRPAPELGFDAGRLAYSSDDLIVFNDYFGAFIYSLKDEKIIDSVDVVDLGFNCYEGDGATYAYYNEEKNILALSRADNLRYALVDLSTRKSKEVSEEVFNKWIKENIKEKPKGELYPDEAYDPVRYDCMYYKPEGSDKIYRPFKNLVEYYESVGR